MTIIAYIQGSNSPTLLGNLKDGGTITIDGVTCDIPDYAQKGGRLAPRRIVETLERMGYKPATDYYSDLGKPDANGLSEIRVVTA